MEFTWEFDNHEWVYDVDDDALFAFFASKDEYESTLKVIERQLSYSKDLSDICESGKLSDAMLEIRNDESLLLDMIDECSSELAHELERDVLDNFERKAYADYCENYDDSDDYTRNGVSWRDFI